MKNFEKYIDKFIDGIKDTFGCYDIYEMMFDKRCNADSPDDDIEWETSEEFDELCRNKFCVNCKFKCGVTNWLLEEYVEPIKLSHDEYVILKNLDKRYRYIARDEFKNELWIYLYMPKKNESGWNMVDEDDASVLEMFNHLFKFIKWEDEEPYSIEQLIADYEKEHEDE